MNYKWIAGVVLIFLEPAAAMAQRDQGYQVLRMTSAFTSFPDTGRAKAWLDGDSVLQPVAGHYDDSSVILVVPPRLKRSRNTDLIFWFHGWHNNIDTALQFYGLARQFAAANCDAVLVLGEAARNSADSYGGKLKQKGDFAGLVRDVMNELKRYGVVPADAVAGHIVLGCHSGGYSAVADILANVQVPVDEVYLFDALYGRLPVFMDWIRQDRRHHFVHWYTDHGGGTDVVSDTLMRQLGVQHIDYLLTTEALLDAGQIRNSRVLFVHSTREHNVIIDNPDDFKLLLENSSVLLRKR
ncbi:MAG TPA: hypothetical protein VMH27_03995 [Puia sp.]|nr:hypothetical protein [Puia sp.]